MAAVVSSLVWQNAGSEVATEGLVTFSSTYVTAGVALTANQLGLGTVNSVAFDNGSGYIYRYFSGTSKVKLFQVAGFTPAGSGTAAAQIFTGAAASLTATSTKPTFTIEASSSIGTNMEVGLSADSAAATFEGGVGITAQRVLTTTSPVGTPTITPGAYTPTGTNATSAVTFTGTAVAAGPLIEVANGTSIAAANTNFRAVGY